MPSLDLLVPFFVATCIFACIPGPGMLYAAAQTVARGRRVGWWSAIGFHIAGYVHIFAAAFGLAVLLEVVPVLYGIIKFVGAAYLIWLGIRLFISRDAHAGATTLSQPPSLRRALRESMTVEVLNPKTALFYLAFLPQFTDLSAALPVWGQILILGTIVNCIFSFTDAACVMLSDQISRLLRRSESAKRLAKRIGGGILVALGLNLAASRP